MSGKRITDQQGKLYMSARRLGHSQSVAAAKAGFSERTGRYLEKQGSLPSQRPRKDWRRRKEVFSEVWEGVVVPLLRGKEQLSAVSILEHLQDGYPGEYSERHLRTLQRRIQKWRALDQNGTLFSVRNMCRVVRDYLISPIPGNLALRFRGNP